MFFEHRTSEAWCSSYGLLKIKENTQSVRLDLMMQDVARLNSDCSSHWKIPGFLQIISDHFWICCCKPCRSQTSVAQAIDFRYLLRQNYKGFKSETGSPHCWSTSSIHCWGSMSFKNARLSRWCISEAASWMNRKWTVVCRSVSGNSSGKTFHRKSW
jgi:hypothetical protein